ncbi:MAG: sigma-70 family RNA polymerase sigma factor [Clostridia bacterium]|nr:sigma-70 family RNA polymerase sigma factor [Clostridia bacterium]
MIDIDKQRELIKHARDGDNEALEELLITLKPMVSKLARGYFLTNGDNADLIQEGMIGVYKAFLSYNLDSEISFSSFAATCVRRQMISAVRVSLNKKNLPLNQYVGIGVQGGLIVEKDNIDSTDDDDFEYMIPSEELTPEERIMLHERNMELNKYIQENLSEFEQNVLKYYLDGESYKQIAKLLDKNEKSVDNAIVRIKSKLKFLEK